LICRKWVFIYCKQARKYELQREIVSLLLVTNRYFVTIYLRTIDLYRLSKFFMDSGSSSFLRHCSSCWSKILCSFFFSKLQYYAFFVAPFLSSILWICVASKDERVAKRWEPVIVLGVCAGTYTSRSLVSEMNFNGAIRDSGEKRNRLIEQSTWRLPSWFDVDLQDLSFFVLRNKLLSCS